MVCDDSDVVKIPKDIINEKLLTKLQFIEFQEDIWSYCIDTLKIKITSCQLNSKNAFNI